MNPNEPIRLSAIEVNQPLGAFYIVKIKASVLLDISYSNPLKVVDSKGSLLGNQRELQQKRIKEIAEYIQTTECAFPNSIIISANYYEDGSPCEEEFRWRVEKENEDRLKLVIPSYKKIASIIDGQHRLNGFEFVDKEYRDIELLCSIYLDLPLSYQAYIFATINFNQKKVDRSLAYELFGYNLENEPEESWSPDKLSVSLTRKLNLDLESPFYKHILIAAQDDHILFEVSPKKLEWYVSTATVVDGIINLISSNSKRDRDALYKYRIGEGRHRKILQLDNAPLRNLYLSINDLAIYKTVLNFFTAANNTLFHQAQKNSYVRKTVGIQALFDVLREILTREFSEKKDIRIEYFSQKLQPASVVDFSDNFFQASGVGRSRIRNILLVAMEYTDIEKVKQEDRQLYTQLLNPGPNDANPIA